MSGVKFWPGRALAEGACPTGYPPGQTNCKPSVPVKRWEGSIMGLSIGLCLPVFSKWHWKSGTIVNDMGLPLPGKKAKAQILTNISALT